MADTEDYSEGGALTAHHTSHENGGSDEVTVQGLSGLLADGQTPLAHKTSHQDAGTDEISVTGLSGVLADDQHVIDAEVTALIGSTQPAAHKTSHQDGGADEISVTGLSGTLADAQTPAAHKTSHQDGGADEISVTGLSGLLADAQKVTVRKNTGADVGTRKRLNLIEGTNITLTVADDATGDEIDITLAAAGGGLIAQVVYFETGAVATGTTILPVDNTIPQKDEGDQFMSLAITPGNVNNLLKIDVVIFLVASGTTVLAAALFQDTTAAALAAGISVNPSNSYPHGINFTHWMVAGTTSQTTFKVRGGSPSSGTTTFNGKEGAGLFDGVLASSITITEKVV